MASSPATPSLSALKALRRLFATETSTKNLPDAGHPVWPWLDKLTSDRAAAPAPAHILTAPEAPHSWLLVLTEDQPFLTDTLVLAARRCGLEVLGLWYPVVSVSRTKGRLVNVAPSRGSASKTASKQAEAWVLMCVNRLEEEEETALLAEVDTGLKLTQAVVEDFPTMLETLKTQAALAQGEEKAFLDWLVAGYMVLLGYRHYDYAPSARGLAVTATEGSGLGILRLEASHVAHSTPLTDLNTSLGLYVDGGEHLVLSKTPNLSKVHRAASMDYVAIIERDAQHNVVAEHRFLGLYTSSAYTTAVRDIPLVRAKLDAVTQEINWPANSHSARSLANILETWPRDELFLTDTPTLTHLTREAVLVRERADVRILLRHSPREQAVTALVYIPLARMHTHIREEVGHILATELNSHVQEFKVEMGVLGGESDMARIFFRLPWHGTPPLDEALLTQKITALVRGWDDEVFDALAATHGEAVASQWLHRMGQLGGPAYRAATPAVLAAADMAVIQQKPPLLAQVVAEATQMRLRLFRTGQAWKLSDLMPLVDSCGLSALREETFALGEVWLHEILCELPANFTEPGRVALEAVLQANLAGLTERDSLNWLALGAALGPLEINVWRAWVMYLQQVDRRFDPRSIRHMVRVQPHLARALWELFEATHAPGLTDRARAKVIKANTALLEQAILGMSTAEEERIWKTLLGVVQATLRTNVWQVQSPNEAYAFKLECAEIPFMPEPAPWREMMVYHPTVVGVHLRGGPVARGGLRHSDRKYDFRTEILGLMTAQMRKNTIIVPVGAKGGFFIQQALPADKKAAGDIILACYRRYISALLSLTDTYDAQGRVLPPRNVVRLDGDDPYLVVAADKGTARFSDVANTVATEAAYWDNPDTGAPVKGFWLDDAFASGGSKGYDHKGMAITARGAWVSVEHHLAALGLTPTEAKPITVAGIGDMSGDVFGNGLLRSPYIKLVAAFNHQHIFLDPTPDPAASFAERQRMFDKGLGWDGYDTATLSAGGGVYHRHAKTVTVSPQALAALGLPVGKSGKEMSPEAVISAILKAPVDVLWNGGIGTYIKASDEPHSAAADKTNDDVRIDAPAVRAKVIGEGGNLGITPRGRVELGLKGVRLNTDAMDNSAGVDTSDHEVNLKILFQQAKIAGQLDEPGRVELLGAMTETVAELVLEDNRQQNLVLSLDEAEPPMYHAELHEWQQTLIKEGIVDSVVDCLPTLKALMNRDEPRYTRPELAALLAGTKTWLRRVVEKDETLLASEAVTPLLVAYFPPQVRARFEALIPQHLLAKQLGATVLSNLLVNRLGILAIPRLMRDFDTSAGDAARALTIAQHALQVPTLLADTHSATAPVPYATVVAVNQRLRTVVGNLSAWLMRHGQPVDVPHWLERLTWPMEQAYDFLPTILREKPTTQKWAEEWHGMGLSTVTAQKMSVLSPMSVAPDAIDLAEVLQRPLSEVLAVHLEVGELLRLPPLVKRVRTMPLPDSWTRQAVQAMGQELFVRQRRLTEALMRGDKGLNDWRLTCGATCHRYDALVRDILKERTLTVPMLSVIIGRLRELEG